MHGNGPQLDFPVAALSFARLAISAATAWQISNDVVVSFF